MAAAAAILDVHQIVEKVAGIGELERGSREPLAVGHFEDERRLPGRRFRRKIVQGPKERQRSPASQVQSTQNRLDEPDDRVERRGANRTLVRAGPLR
jgi:hypothetical protein